MLKCYWMHYCVYFQLTSSMIWYKITKLYHSGHKYILSGSCSSLLGLVYLTLYMKEEQEGCDYFSHQLCVLRWVYPRICCTHLWPAHHWLSQPQRPSGHQSDLQTSWMQPDKCCRWPDYLPLQLFSAGRHTTLLFVSAFHLHCVVISLTRWLLMVEHDVTKIHKSAWHLLVSLSVRLSMDRCAEHTLNK